MTAGLFPSPVGEVVSYIHSRSVNIAQCRFPSPVGEVVSYIRFYLNGVAIDSAFPSPVGEVVSYILPLPDGSVMRQK